MTTTPWEPGRSVSIRYGRYDTTRWVFTGNVIADTPTELAIHLPTGAPTVTSTAADGTPIAELPRERLSEPRVPAMTSWYGESAIFVFPVAVPWSVWMFFEPDGRLHRWKINLERPHTRWTDASGNAFVDTSDRTLDVIVYADRTWELKDEREFAEVKTGVPGYFTPELAERIRGHAAESAALAVRGEGVFDGRYTDVVRDPSWAMPVLPETWREPHANWP
ncbi:hypothetical protein Afil01_34860 [Actinorhabdospora filicis]|uniref:DUF402 domain-containing protein n=1 Tax=Actinorhabdospora filicis TaxID=1785913 RepID=A0A9W6W9I8_9ACTN|nr:DUF402 domain-containing protein [Actinorhabdospora filicis]GLZ78679.1 hypothetical protein Afil01_34860 [Actinorhabdospora filicis]